MPDGVASGLIWAAIILVLWFTGAIFSKQQKGGVADRPELPYTSFSEDYDVVVTADNLPEQLAADGVEYEAPRGSAMEDLAARLKQFELATVGAEARLTHVDGRLDGQAICFLLVLSGSMVKRLPVVLGELQAIHTWAGMHGASCAILGFTTRGWKGGLVRKKWEKEGRPAYPGRLCALMHVEIAPFNGVAPIKDWGPLLRPDVLRENVDGEAIRWAVSSLNGVPADRRRLFVLSDGAPVDDSTLAENGPGYLMRHLVETIDVIEDLGQIEIVGVGLSHRVEGLYRTSAFVDEEVHLSDVIMPIIVNHFPEKRINGA